jgi:hypothetical protein
VVRDNPSTRTSGVKLLRNLSPAADLRKLWETRLRRERLFLSSHQAGCRSFSRNERSL